MCIDCVCVCVLLCACVCVCVCIHVCVCVCVYVCLHAKCQPPERHCWLVPVHTSEYQPVIDVVVAEKDGSTFSPP